MVSGSDMSAGDDDGNVLSRPSSSSGKKKQNKVSRKTHKAEREKQKRDHMNVLFLELSKAIDSASQSNGKASILKDTTRLIKELVTQLDTLKKENAALLSESHYVTMEKNELGEENSVLETQIQNLRGDLEKKAHTHESSVRLSICPSQISGDNHHGLPSSTDNPTSQGTPIVGPVLIIPLQHESQVLSQSDPADESMPSNVSKPRPRYPSSSDSWPSHILDKQQQQSAGESTRQSNYSTC